VGALCFLKVLKCLGRSVVTRPRAPRQVYVASIMDNLAQEFREWSLSPGATLSFCTAVGCRRLPFLRVPHRNLAAISCRNDGVIPRSRFLSPPFSVGFDNLNMLAKPNQAMLPFKLSQPTMYLQ
jgi:hypothetical protein